MDKRIVYAVLGAAALIGAGMALIPDDSPKQQQQAARVIPPPPAPQSAPAPVAQAQALEPICMSSSAAIARLDFEFEQLGIPRSRMVLQPDGQRCVTDESVIRRVRALRGETN